MNRKTLSHNLPLRLVKLLNIILLTIPFALCWYFYYAKQVQNINLNLANGLMILLYLILYITFARIYDAFFVSMYRIREMVYSQVLAACIADGIIYIVITILAGRFTNLLPGIAAIILQVFFSAMWSYFGYKWYFDTYPPKKTIIVYDLREGMDKLIEQYEMRKKFNVVAVYQVKECLKDVTVLDDVDTVFLSGIHSKDRNVILKYCVEKDIDVFLIPRVGDVIMSGAVPVHMLHLPVFRVGRYDPNPEFIFIKRLMDIVICGIATIILSPIMLITAIAIMAYDRGPAFYKQTRLTKDGKEFKVLKFRSMKVNAEKDGVARLSSGENDPRITPIGRLIRACRIDELPQLINILKGEMTIVGPRPERPEIAAEYEKTMPEFRLRLQAKAGLTGYAQVYGKYNTTPYDKLQMDLMYISRPSIFEDLKIMFATVKILFLAESTEGVAEGQTTAMENQTSDQTNRI